MFMQALSEAGLAAGRTVRVLRAAGQAADHVISPVCPESAYLKCFFCYVV
jgi:23S rRNA G2069 N7-methylase RlmK/C1962 C5-methylase RlmI